MKGENEFGGGFEDFWSAWPFSLLFLLLLFLLLLVLLFFWISPFCIKDDRDGEREMLFFQSEFEFAPWNGIGWAREEKVVKRFFWAFALGAVWRVHQLWLPVELDRVYVGMTEAQSSTKLGNVSLFGTHVVA